MYHGSLSETSEVFLYCISPRQQGNFLSELFFIIGASECKHVLKDTGSPSHKSVSDCKWNCMYIKQYLFLIPYYNGRVLTHCSKHVVIFFKVTK